MIPGFKSDRRFVLWLHDGHRGKLLLRGVGSDEHEDVWFDGVASLHLTTELNGLDLRLANRTETAAYLRSRPNERRAAGHLFVLRSAGRVFHVWALGAWTERVRLAQDHPAFYSMDYLDLLEDEDFRTAHVFSRQLLSPTL